MQRAAGSRQLLLVDAYDSFTHNLAHAFFVAGCDVRVVRCDEVTAEQVAAHAPNPVVFGPGPGAPEEAGCFVPAIRALRDQAERSRRHELERALKALERGQDARHVLERMSEALTNKLMHPPTRALNAASDTERETLRDRRST